MELNSWLIILKNIWGKNKMRKNDHKTFNYWINIAIGLAFMFLFPLLPPISPITQIGMKIIGVFIGMVYLWATVDGIWPELIGLIVIGLSGYVEGATGYNAVKSVFANSFGSDTVIGITLIMFATSAIDGVGLTKYITHFFLSRKSMEGRPYFMLFYFLVCSYILSGMTSALISLFVLWPVAVELCKKCNIQKGNKFFYSLICGIYLAATVGQPMLPFKGAIFAVLATFEKAFSLKVDTFAYIVLNVILAFLVFVAYIFIVKYILRPEIGLLKEIKVKDILNDDLEKMNFAQKIVGLATIAMILCIVLPSILPKYVFGVSFLNSVGLIGISSILMVVFLLFRDENNKPLINLKEYSKRSFSWEIYFQVPAALFIADAITSDASGVKLFLTQMISTTLGKCTAMLFIIIMVVIAIAVTNVANNMTVGVILMSVLPACAEQFKDVNMVALAVLVAISVFIALLTPAASPYCGMLHARKDLISTKDIMKIFIPTIFAIAIIYIVIGYPLATLLF